MRVLCFDFFLMVRVSYGVRLLCFFVLCFCLIFVLCAFYSCKSDGKGSSDRRVESVGVPDYASMFSADSAYRYVSEQCSFGPRVPGSVAHERCAEYLVKHFVRCAADTVVVQRGEATLYDGSVMPLLNIIASYRSDLSQRVVVCAHWDSRPFADEEARASDRRQAIIGANDGASGVGVIMEMARVFSLVRPNVGIDFILFDLEDWGAPDWADVVTGDGGWALGSGYWADNRHVEGYSAQYGILLDMVGGAGAQFYRELISDSYASWVVDRVWQCAADMGLGSMFVNRPGGGVTDDHINLIRAGIPCIDIVQHNPESATGFFDLWHTTSDNIKCIDSNTLYCVGRVVLGSVCR